MNEAIFVMKKLLFITFLVFIAISQVVRSFAQFATVQGTVQASGGVKVPGAYVIFLDSRTGIKTRNARTNGDYLIEQLDPNVPYQFAGCAFPYGEDKSNWKKRKLGSNPVTINFLVGPMQQFTRQRVLFSFHGLPTNAYGVLDLIDAETHCILAQVDGPDKSYKTELTYTIPGYGPGILACAHLLAKSEDASCLPTK